MRTRSLFVVTLVAALALSLWAPAAAHGNGNGGSGRGHGAGSGPSVESETVIGRDWDDAGECATIVARSRGGKGLVAALDWTNDCPGRWLSAPVTACLPDGTRTEYVWLFVEDDITMDRGMLSRLGLRPATHMATFPGSVSGWGTSCHRWRASTVGTTSSTPMVGSTTTRRRGPTRRSSPSRS